MKTICFFLAIAISGILSAQNIYVSPGGDDSNPGSLGSPKKSIQAAADLMKGGDTLFLRGGCYHEEVVLSGKSGSELAPFVFRAYGDELPIIDGTVDLKDIKTPGASWELATDVFPGTANIYKISVEEDIWQLWVRQPGLMQVLNAAGGERAGYRMQVIARWPNGNTNPTDPLIKAPDGIAARVNTWWSLTTTWAFAASPQTSHTVIENNPSRFSLAGTGKSFEGGTAILSIVKQGPANTPVQILEHAAGSDVFVHSGMSESYGLYSNTSTLGPSYIVQHLNALDIPGEWYYDDDTKTVYLWPEDNSDPNFLDIRGKNQSYGLELNDCEHFVFDGISLFGTSMKLAGDHVSFINGAISYPDMPKTLLGYSGVVIPAIYANDCRNFLMQNCVVEYSQSSIIQVKNVGGTFDNNYFHHLGMTGMGASGSFHNVNTFTNNTIRTVGNRAMAKCNSEPREGRKQSWNILDGWGFLYANDGVGFQSSQGGSVDSERAYNWFIRSNRSGHRYDGPEEGLGFPTLGLSHHLVGLRGVSVSTTIKGDYNELYNYLGILGTNENGDIAVRWNLETGEGNKHTVLHNSAADGINIGKWHPLPCINSHNWDASKKGGSMLDFHPEADLLDFRPRAGAPLIDAGIHVPGITDGYLGAAPDIGAYEWGDDTYWIPGQKIASTSIPIPFDGAREMKLDRDLIFNHAFQSDQAIVYFGTDQASVLAAGPGTAKAPGMADIPGGDVVRISLDSGRNIVTPTMLAGNPNAYDPAPYLLPDDPHISLPANTSFYWRADAVSMDGELVKGDVWSFSTGDRTELLQFRIFTDNDGVVEPGASVTVKVGNSLYSTDSSGFISEVRLSPGTYPYTISRKGYHSSGGSLLLEADTLITDTITVARYQCSITIRDADMGTAIPGALVDLGGQMQATSDDKGFVQFNEIEYGFYTISVEAKDYLLSELRDIEIFSDTVLYISLGNNYKTGQFTVIDKYSQDPIYRATMTSLQGEVVMTNENGMLDMKKVASGWWHFHIEHEDYFSLDDSLFITEDTTRAVFKLAKNKANVTLIVSDEQGPFEGASISFGTYQATSSQDGMAWFYFLPAREEYVYSVDSEMHDPVSDTFLLERDTTLNILLQTLSANRTSHLQNISIYPNPAREYVRIELDERDADIELLRMDGSILLMQKLYDGKAVIGLDDTSPGIYMLRITGKNILHCRKFIMY